MTDYVITTASGKSCLVRADSKDVARVAWDMAAGDGHAEPRNETRDAEPATAEQVARIGGTQHDYR